MRKSIIKPIYRYISNWLFLLIFTAAFVSTFLFSSLGQAQPELAFSTYSFIDSIGVNTHLYYDETVYYRNFYDIIKPKLQMLGIHHLRDGAVINSNGYFNRLKELEFLGIRANLNADPRAVSTEQALAVVKLIGSAVESIEGPNEYDSYQSTDSNWTNTIISYQKQLYQTFKADRDTAWLPVLAPSFINPASYPLVGDLSGYLDYGNMHSYPAGQYPGVDGYGGISYNINLAQQISGQNKQIAVTETGYFNTLNSTGISEAAAGKYIPRLFLENFNYGIPRTYDYELIDVNNDPSNSESNYGLLRNDGSEKPAYVALKNLISLLSDPGVNSAPDSLDYTLIGNTTNLHHLLLQKSNKTFYLLLWQEISSFDLQQKVDLSTPAVPITLKLNTSISQATTYYPYYSSTLCAQYSNPNQLTLYVLDSPLVIELLPAIHS